MTLRYTQPVKLFAISAILLLSATLTHAQNSSPEAIYFHGNILTGAHLRPNDPSETPAKVTAIAISQGKITAIGIDANILKLKGPQTKLIDLNSAFAMPGFNDAHTHIAYGGQQKLTIDLDGVTSLAEMQQRIKAFATTAKPGTWLQGGGWDHTLWPTKTLPTRADIDAVTAGHPAVFSRTDGHIVIANSAALAAANITSKTPDPPGSKIDRDPTGNPTGIVREGPATSIIFKVIPRPSLEDRRRALEVAIADALAHGVTSVQDLSDWEDFLALEELERTGKLHLRVSEWLDFNLPVDTLKQRQASHPADDPLLHTGMLKGFMDGSLGSRTAALKAPYSDDPGNSGIPRYDQKTLDRLSTERAEAGFQLGFHAIGDRANGMALAAFERAQQARMKRISSLLPQLEATTHANVTVTDTSRYRIEHAQVVSPGDFDLYARLHVIASMQPSHLLTDMNWATDRLGPDRAKYSYAWRSFLDHNVVLAFGTDYPVESINPFRGLYAAITRQNEAGTRTYQPQEKITLQEALYAYTQASAFAENQEKKKGRLEPGFLADFIVLDRDITAPGATPQQLLHTKVLRTVVSGETVYVASVSTGVKGDASIITPEKEEKE
jgi:predicted amidohydrolase YtcJ